MGYYACRKVKDLLPDYIIKQQGPDYEGGCNYDGDMWYAAADYILDLKSQRDELLAALRGMVQLDIENHQRGDDDIDISKEVQDAYNAIANAEKAK